MTLSGGVLNQQDQDRIANSVPGVSGIQVFREHIEARNAVEYTIYFKVNNGTQKVRADLWVDDAQNISAREDAKEYVEGLAIDAIRSAKESYEEKKRENA